MVVCISPCQQSGARFLLWHPSAKSIAMGGIGAAIDKWCICSILYPTSLGFINRTSISTSFGQPYPFFEYLGQPTPRLRLGKHHNNRKDEMMFRVKQKEVGSASELGLIHPTIDNCIRLFNSIVKCTLMHTTGENNE